MIIFFKFCNLFLERIQFTAHLFDSFDQKSRQFFVLDGHVSVVTSRDYLRRHFYDFLSYDSYVMAFVLVDTTSRNPIKFIAAELQHLGKSVFYDFLVCFEPFIRRIECDNVVRGSDKSCRCGSGSSNTQSAIDVEGGPVEREIGFPI